MDTGEIPQQFGVVLVFGDSAGLDFACVRRLIAERIPAVPRLRQRLVHAPFGCGGPIWIDDPQFDIRNHVRAIACREPQDEPALLNDAMSVIATRLRRTGPLWAAVLVTGLADGQAALVFVAHHALADGVGGLAVLANLVDGRPGTGYSRCPRPAPSTATLAKEASLGRLRALRRIAPSWQLLRASMSAGGGLRPPRAPACSLNRQTGPRRGIAVVRAEVARLQAAAHLHAATVNDAVLVAVAGALSQVLADRGESLDELKMAVPVSGRRPENESSLGNMVSPMLVPVPASGAIGTRLEQVATRVRTLRADATGPAPLALLGWLFRPLAAVGGYHWYINHQHQLNTLVSHVRGPAE